MKLPAYLFSMIAILLIAAAFPTQMFAQTDEEVEELYREMSPKFSFMQAVKDVNRNMRSSQKLEIVISQKEDLKALVEAYDSEVNLLAAKRDEQQKKVLSDVTLSAIEQQEKLKSIRYESGKRFNEFYDKTLRKVKTVLLPHQYRTLELIALKDQLWDMNRSEGVKGFRVVLDQVELSKEEKREVNKILKETQEEYESELKKIRKDFEKKATGEFPAHSQKILKELFGDWYYFDR